MHAIAHKINKHQNKQTHSNSNMHAIARTQCNSNIKETAIIILHSIAYASKASCIHCIIQHINIKLLMFYIVHGGTTAHTPTGKQESDSKEYGKMQHNNYIGHCNIGYDILFIALCH